MYRNAKQGPAVGPHSLNVGFGGRPARGCSGPNSRFFLGVGSVYCFAMKAYEFGRIEAKWQRYWVENATFRVSSPGEPEFDSSKPKYYIVDMFPFPSGKGLHVGHPLGYFATDMMARYKRMRGFNVLHPMGYDSFGLPAEQYAVETGTHPRETTEQNRVPIFTAGRSCCNSNPRPDIVTVVPLQPRLGEML